MKLLDWILESYICEMVNIDEMQFGLVSGRGTTDVIFVVCQLQEKYIAANKLLYFAFVDLEKALDRVPKKVLWLGFRSLGVEEWAVSVIPDMYSNARSQVRVNGQYSKEFGVEVGVHQGFVLYPLLSILMLDAFSRKFSTGVTWCSSQTPGGAISKFNAWKAGMAPYQQEEHQIPGLWCWPWCPQKSGKYPFGGFWSAASNNSIQCSQCILWVHKRCSCITKR